MEIGKKDIEFSRYKISKEIPWKLKNSKELVDKGLIETSKIPWACQEFVGNNTLRKKE